MRSDDAITALTDLAYEGTSSLGAETKYVEWRSKPSAVLRAAFGPRSHEVQEFDQLTALRREGYTLAKGLNRDLEAWRMDAVNRGKGALRAAIFTLQSITKESPLDEASIDVELWSHVQGLVASDDWAKVPAAVAIFVEDRVRTLGGRS